MSDQELDMPDEVVAVGTANSAQEFSTELLRVYYGRLFPFEQMFNWLSYSNTASKDTPGIDRQYFPNREWSFTIENDIYIRYQSFRDESELRNAIIKKNPHKIDIGAVFNAKPSEQSTSKSASFQPLERELVFDIDMTDYDDIRVCCTGADICRRCWPYMTMAVKVVDAALREDFAFKHVLWVYSGRRGIHCWVCDPEARKLSNEARSAIVDYLSVSVSGPNIPQLKAKENSNDVAANTDKFLKNGISYPLHPMLRRAYDQLSDYFERHVADEQGQGLLSKQNYVRVLNSLPNEGIRVELYKRWSSETRLSGAERWRQLVSAITPNSSDAVTRGKNSGKRKNIDYGELDKWRFELVFYYCYPRLDANVSKTQNHLLKSPFCVHPKTGRVCVPIDPATADDFDPFTVPTVRTLCNEVDQYDRIHQNDNEKLNDINKTSLKVSTALFDRTFLSSLLRTNQRQIRERAAVESGSVLEF